MGPSNRDRVSLGEWVVVRFGTEKSYLYNINKDSHIKIGPYKCKTIDLLDCEYGSQFEPSCNETEHNENDDAPVKLTKRKRGHLNLERTAKLLPVPEPDIQDVDLIEIRKQQLYQEIKELEAQKLVRDTGQRNGDNRDLLDLKENQQIEEEELEKMKATGMSIEDVVDALKQNSKTFLEKSAHAQDKYVVNKRKKHSTTIRVLRCASATIGEVLWDGTRLPGSALGGLRYQDTLPQMLAYGNVHSGARVLVCETICGYLMGSVIERMGGYGETIALYIGPTFPKSTAVNYFNFSEEEKSVLRRCDMRMLLGGSVGDEGLESISQAEERRRHGIEKIEDAEEKKNKQEEFDMWLKKKERDRKAQANQKETFKFLREEGADSLLIASKYEPESTFTRLLPYVRTGGRFVLFSEFLEPLVRLREQLESSRQAIGVRVTETWLRKHQVIPKRTHPTMRMNGASGYILHGIKVENNERIIG